MTKKDSTTYLIPALKEDETLITDNINQSELLFDLLDDIISETLRDLRTDTLMKLIEARTLANELTMNADTIEYRYRHRW